MLTDTQKATLEIFKALPIDSSPGKPESLDTEVAKATIRYGFLFAPEVEAYYSKARLLEMADDIGKLLGLTPEQMNKTFHQSWEKVRDTPMFIMVMEQILHYITTYGAEELGIFDSDNVYIPYRAEDYPEETACLRIIHGITKAEIKEKLLALVQSGIALRQESIDAIVLLSENMGIGKELYEASKNREVSQALRSVLGITAEDPAEFLRGLIQDATGKTLLIKDRATIKALKENADKLHDKLVAYSPVKLASVFYRFKPLFLALRTHPANRPFINKVRRLAKTHHKPMRRSILDSVTSLTQSPEIEAALDRGLQRANIFRKVRLANALTYRSEGTELPFLYKIRNGKAFAKRQTLTTKKAPAFSIVSRTDRTWALSRVKQSIAADLSGLKGKRVYIPEWIDFGIPVSEKKFLGGLPHGTAVTLPKMCIGIHWLNLPNSRVDLDLSMLSLDVKIGWDAGYRHNGGRILFSGDITDAPPPHGAAEVFRVVPGKPGTYLLMLNWYNKPPTTDKTVPFSLFISKATQLIRKDDQKETSQATKLRVDPRSVVMTQPLEIQERQMVLGIVEITKTEVIFYAGNAALGSTITARHSPHSEIARGAMIHSARTCTRLSQLIDMIGAVPVTSREDAEIVLDPNEVTTEQFLDIMGAN